MADSVSTTSSSSSKEDVRVDISEAAGGCKADDSIPGNKTPCAAPSSATGDSGWEKLIQKQRSELMFELRKLQHGEKPVTGKDARQKVENFLQEQTNPRMNTRPERSPNDPLVLEVQGLFERRRVTSVLESSSFKRDLENVIRGTIIRQEGGADKAHRERREQERAAGAMMNTEDNWDTLSQSSFVSAVSSHSSMDHLTWPAPPSFTPPHVPTNQPYPMMNIPPPPPALPPQPQPTMMNQFPPQYPQQHQSPWPQMPQQQSPWPQMPQQQGHMNMTHQWQRMHQHPMPAAQPQQMYHGMSPWQQMPQQPFPHQPQTQGWQQRQPTQVRNQWQQQPPNARIRLPQQQQPQTGSDPGQVREAQREELVSEISELVHRRLVSQSLDGDLRGRLEIHLQRRLEGASERVEGGETGVDRQHVADFVRSLRSSTPHRRNDFSNLGIQVPLTAEEEMSYMSNANPMLETMRQELEELKNMVRMNFEMQLDIQRAIRQEVAAALATVAGGSNASPSCAPASTAQPLQDGNCLICLDRGVDSVLYQCGHMCVCMTCGLRLKGQGLNCPMCRAPIRDVIRAYRCVAENVEESS
ncbi:uncharacterized protein LOC144446403 [Glandiceps talaboti]